MDSLLSALSLHGYWILFLLVFLQAIGAPVPLALALLIAGGASAHGSLYGPYVLAGALLAMVSGDTLMFVLGRYTGWWLLGILCRISINPESCILSSADSFYRRGRALLVVAKFIPGINTMAPPLAGSMHMRLFPFLCLDAAGAALYICSYFALGYVFSDALEAVTRGYQTFSRSVGLVIVVLIAAYLGYQCWAWFRARRGPRVVFATPADVARQLATGGEVYDVRSHGYLDARAVRIRGSKRLDPHALNQAGTVLPSGEPVYVYCTCAREATSARVARQLDERGIRVSVIRGGLRAWRRAGLPVESVPADELAALPVFK